MFKNIIILIFFLLLSIHYFFQKKYLISGLKKKSRSKEIKKLSINGYFIFLISFVLLMIYEKPYGLIGIFLLIECGVCFSFANKLIKTK